MSTTPNYRELFNTYHNGFQNYGPWLDHHREMHKRHPLECEEFGAEWLRRWEAIGNTLARLVQIQFYGDTREWNQSPPHRPWIQLHSALTDCIERHKAPENTRGYALMRIILLDGTIVREWPAQ